MTARSPDQDEHQHRRRGCRTAGRETSVRDVAKGIEADVVPGHSGDRRDPDDRYEVGSEPGVGPEHPPPAPRRQPAVREQQDNHCTWPMEGNATPGPFRERYRSARNPTRPQITNWA